MNPKTSRTQLALIPFALIAILLVVALQECKAQVEINGKSYYSPTVTNMMKAATMTTPEWRERMSTYGFSNSGYEVNCPYVSSGSLGKDDYMIIKCPTTVSFMWRSPFKNSLLGKAVDELEPYFTEMSGEMSIYKLRDEFYSYKFVVRRNTVNGIFELIVVHAESLN